MISVYVKKFNGEFHKSDYEKFINNLDQHRLKCVCGHYGMNIHGYYKRYIVTDTGKEYINILRVKCPFCNKTHAIMPSNIIAYSHIQLPDQLTIITDDEVESLMIRKIQIDENVVKRVKKNYGIHFKEKLKSFGISLKDDLVLLCNRYFKCNFNQIRRCSYELFIQDPIEHMA